MHLQPFKDQRADTKERNRKNPEIRRGIKMFEKPFLLIDRAAVTIHDINHWIQFKERLHLIGQNRNIPQDRRRPHPDLKHNTDDLLQIPEKNNHRTGDITASTSMNSQKL